MWVSVSVGVGVGVGECGCECEPTCMCTSICAGSDVCVCVHACIVTEYTHSQQTSSHHDSRGRYYTHIFDASKRNDFERHKRY